VPAGTRSTSSPGLTAQQFQHELRKSLFAIRQRYLIDQHTLYSSGSLHGGGDANVRALPPTSNAAQRLSATSNADTLRSVLRDETCTSHNLPPSCKQRMLRGFDAAQHRHRHRDPSRRVQRMTCMAQTHPHSRVSTHLSRAPAFSIASRIIAQQWQGETAKQLTTIRCTSIKSSALCSGLQCSPWTTGANSV
jgi:hypothetical protein